MPHGWKKVAREKAPPRRVRHTGNGRSEHDPRPAVIPPGAAESFAALGCAVAMDVPMVGEVWLVPEYTGRRRKEITAQDAVAIITVMDAFPSRVMSFDMEDGA